MKTLETQRLLLRAWQESDAGDLFAYGRLETARNDTGASGYHQALPAGR